MVMLSALHSPTKVTALSLTQRSRRRRRVSWSRSRAKSRREIRAIFIKFSTLTYQLSDISRWNFLRNR